MAGRLGGKTGNRQGGRPVNFHSLLREIPETRIGIGGSLAAPPLLHPVRTGPYTAVRLSQGVILTAS